MQGLTKSEMLQFVERNIGKNVVVQLEYGRSVTEKLERVTTTILSL
jgi:hypothetical protein